MGVLRHVAVLIIALAAAGCVALFVGAVQTTPHQWHGAGGIVPNQKDKDAGLVGIAPGFDIRRYATAAIDRCTVVESEIKDAEDHELAHMMAAFLQAETVRRLSATGLFDSVVSLGEAPPPASPNHALRIECVLTRLAPGSVVTRFFGGHGAGRTKAEVEFRFVEVQSDTVVMVTADRRVAASPLESEVLLRESFHDMARDLAKLLMRLSKGEVPKD